MNAILIMLSTFTMAFGLALGFIFGRIYQIGLVRDMLAYPFKGNQKARIELTEDEARAIDEENPPKYSHYKTKGYDPDQAPKCTCHGRTVGPGEKVLLWPIPDDPDGAMDLFCMETCMKASR